MSTKKTIQINPELFKMSSNKTRKNKEKKEVTIKPLITPNSLKTKLLNRIKEHKARELTYDNKPKKNMNNDVSNSDYHNNNDDNEKDEFYGAINYLSGLKQKQKQQQLINNRTIKNTQQYIAPQIQLDLPPELTEPFKTSSLEPTFAMNYKTNDELPYGCLKNGKKKTYREWKEETNPPDFSDLFRPPTPPKKQNQETALHTTNFMPIANTHIDNTPIISNAMPVNSVREDRLEQIKQKLKKMESQEISQKRQAIENFNALEKELNKPMLPNIDDSINTSTDIEEIIKQHDEKIKREEPKQYIKKTIKRKFTLGKSDKLRRIAVLIKDKQTRKNIIHAQKELKKTNITDVRKYLRQHGLIKVGSTCPTDILRKTFETAILTGEVTNTNKETLLHNFINDTKT